MWCRLGACLLFLFALAPLRGDDSPLVQTSNDQRLRITLLYVGPVNDKTVNQPFVICYLVEDNRSDNDLAQHPGKDAKGYVIDRNYDLAARKPQLKDANKQVMKDDLYDTERGESDDTAQQASFKALYPKVVLPKVDHPDRGGVYEWFLKTVPAGPFDIEIYDYIPAYGPNVFHFHDIASGTSFAP